MVKNENVANPIGTEQMKNVAKYVRRRDYHLCICPWKYRGVVFSRHVENFLVVFYQHFVVPYLVGVYNSRHFNYFQFLWAVDYWSYRCIKWENGFKQDFYLKIHWIQVPELACWTLDTAETSFEQNERNRRAYFLEKQLHETWSQLYPSWTWKAS